MPNKYTVAIHLEGKDELTGQLRQAEKGLEAFGQTAKLGLVPIEKWNRELEEAAEIARRSFPDTVRLADVSKTLTKIYQEQGPAIRQAAEASRQAQAEQAKFLSGIPELFEKAIAASKQYRTETNFVFEAATEGFKTFRKSTADGLENLFSVVFKGETEKFKVTWEKFTAKLGDDFLQMLSRVAAGMTQEVLLKPALELGERALAGLGPALKALFLAQGGLVTKPTVAVLGEEGPELVVPLAKLGGEAFLREAFMGPAVQEAATRLAARAGIAEGIESTAIEAGRAAASAQAARILGAAGQAAFAALEFAEGRASNRGARLGVDLGMAALTLAAPPPVGLLHAGAKIAQAAAPLIERGLEAAGQALSGAGLKAFGKKGVSPEEHGRANIESIRQMTRDFPGFYEAETLIAVTGGNPFLARELMGAAGAFRDLDVGADAAGRFITGPSLRLLGEAGPEHVLNVDSEASVRALREGLRPLLRELFEEERGRGGREGGNVVFERGAFDLRGAFLPDDRSLEKLARMIEEKLRLFKSRRVGHSGA